MGLDVSSTTVGLSIIKDEPLTLVHTEFFKPPKKVHIFKQLEQTKLYVLKKLKQYKPDQIVIEDIIEYIQGGSGSKTTIKLAIFNRTIGLAIFEELGEPPILLNVNTARKLIKPEGYSGRLTKEDVPQALEVLFDQPFPFLYNKKGNIKKESYDMADSVAIAVAHVLNHE